MNFIEVMLVVIFCYIKDIKKFFLFLDIFFIGGFFI